ncbi:3-deoxy-D-manno-octulosonic acid transferase [Bordetella genomosp. 9]|uniref:3-deoxy-D-manno-octulosonic acid transferase n=1 Tax=Bordetella genomosp. 9 TaxID=1416803 RepID=A0A261R7G6_9BORD|nr:3-deoxy-D-manno-octulosonic acid transferase [Bordetella genomosp. 9]OZI20921.1 3-deoxy-D-manno-octulosonic acid transferase [Bordetella genomosp. 9]
MTRFLYTVLLRIFAPLIWLWMRARAGKDGDRWQILAPARFGRYVEREQDRDRIGRVWVHAVSLGEVRAAHPLIRTLLDRGFPLLLTHTTPTGWDEAARVYGGEIANGRLRQAWLPYDFPGSVRRFLRFFKPRCGILIEREVWPNLIHEARVEGVSVVLVSARLSLSSLKQARWFGSALRRAYSTLDLVLAQTVEDAERLQRVGARGPRVVGNLKFDVSLSKPQLEEGRRFRQSLGRPVLAIASTRDGEERWFLGALRARELTPGLEDVLHIIIPRHPQRFSDVEALLQREGVKFARRSSSEGMPTPGISVLLGDTIGEMSFYLGAADVAIVGGGFAPLGGQNLIEACVAGTPVIVGPHMHNFAQATRDAVAAGAALQVTDAESAVRAAYALLSDDARRAGMSRSARAWTASHAGATDRIVELLRPWLGN